VDVEWREADVGQAGTRRSTECGRAGLPRAGHGDTAVDAREGSELGGSVSDDPSVSIWQFPRNAN
jgi:hypothetical protein